MVLFRSGGPILGYALHTTWAEERSEMHMAIDARRWTLDEMHALPEDGNKYELVHGELLVSPAPSVRHEETVASLHERLAPYVKAQQLGRVYRPRAVLRIGREVELEPDIMVRRPTPDPDSDWEVAPLPILVVEVVSKSSRTRDFGIKRHTYLQEADLVEYWIVDGEARTLTRCRPGRDDEVQTSRLEWKPAGAREALCIDLEELW
jgi:Uma2 family endonuclease